MGVWDIDGLLKDTALAEAAALREGRTIKRDDEFEVGMAFTDGEQLFAWLQKYNLRVCKEDYYTREGGWDVAGIRSDLELAKEALQMRRLNGSPDISSKKTE